MADHDLDIRRLRLAPGDVLVLCSSVARTAETAVRVEAWARQVLDLAGHHDTPVMDVGPDISLAILGAAAVGALASNPATAPDEGTPHG